MNLYLDCEFNGFGGPLISMALVAENDDTWYEVLPCLDPIPWVAQNVIPVLGKNPVARRFDFVASLSSFLDKYDTIHVIADWPEDLMHFTQSLMVAQGRCIDTPPLTMQLVSDVKAESAVPHNALEDAKALKRGVNESIN